MLLSLEELKVKFVRWLLKSGKTRNILVEAVMDDQDMQEMVVEYADKAAEHAVDEFERNMSDEVKAEDVRDLDDFVKSVVEDVLEGEKFDRAVNDAVGGLTIDADDVENLPSAIADAVETAQDGYLAKLRHLCNGAP